MKRFGFFLVSLIILLIVLAVLIKPTQEIVSVSLVSETTTITYTDSASLQAFKGAIRTVKKVPGAVDVGPPAYTMIVTYANSKVVEYSLHMDLTTKNGFLIKNSDSDRMLDLRDKNSEELADLIIQKEAQAQN